MSRLTTYDEFERTPLYISNQWLLGFGTEEWIENTAEEDFGEKRAFINFIKNTMSEIRETFRATDFLDEEAVEDYYYNFYNDDERLEKFKKFAGFLFRKTKKMVELVERLETEQRNVAVKEAKKETEKEKKKREREEAKEQKKKEQEEARLERERKKQEREANKQEQKEKRKEKSKEVIQCPCGDTFTRSHKSHHENSIKHRERMSLIEAVREEITTALECKKQP